MKRKERTVYVISRHKLHEGKITKKIAGKEMNCAFCGENFIMKGVSQTFYLYKDDIICYKCAFATSLERQRYGFWIRPLSEHFIPCEECQDKLHEMLFRNTIWTLGKDTVELEIDISDRGDGEVTFTLGFVHYCGSDKAWDWEGIPKFRPCKSCTKNFKELLLNKEIHIGNDVKPMIELWRDWETIEEEPEKNSAHAAMEDYT